MQFFLYSFFKLSYKVQISIAMQIEVVGVFFFFFEKSKEDGAKFKKSPWLRVRKNFWGIKMLYMHFGPTTLGWRGRAKQTRWANLFPFDRTICRFCNLMLTQFLSQELAIPSMLSSNCFICRSWPALGCYFRQEIVIITGLACVFFD